MASRIVLNTISYHGHGAIENIVPELTARGYKKAFVILCKAIHVLCHQIHR